MNEAELKKLAQSIRKAILADVTDRRGWRQEWDQFGDDIQKEIRKAHDEIILAVLKRAGLMDPATP